jgi:hypothetical protein
MTAFINLPYFRGELSPVVKDFARIVITKLDIPNNMDTSPGTVRVIIFFC